MKYFYKGHPDSEDLFGLKPCGCHVLFRETSEKLLLCAFCKCAKQFQEQICIFYFCLSRMRNMSKIALVSSGTKLQLLRKNQRGHVLGCFFFINDKIQNSERLSIFPECPLDFHDFQEQIRYIRNGKHIWTIHQEMYLYKLILTLRQSSF